MKIFFLRMWVVCHRLLGRTQRRDRRIRVERQAESLLRRANPFASWNERANWMIDLVEWLRHVPNSCATKSCVAASEPKQRLLVMLDWLDAHRDARRLVQATLQKTLREAAGPELFCATGLPREPAFFSELVERIFRHVLPRSPAPHDLSALFTAMFPAKTDAKWLLELDHATLSRLTKLCTDEGILHAYDRQIDEALTYLVTMVVSAGISPAFRQRLGEKVPLQASPFMALKREIERYCVASGHDASLLRSVRMLIAVCQAQTDRIYQHLDAHGVSVGLVYAVERMRAQLSRMTLLIDLRAATLHTPQGASQAQALLADLVHAQHARGSVLALVHRSFSLLARKIVERNADHGEHYIARSSGQYRAMMQAAYLGGIVTAFTVLIKFTLKGEALPRFFEGVLASLNYATSFIVITAIGGVLATKQPAVTAPALAARMGNLKSKSGVLGLMQEIAWILRSQAAAVFGNLIAVIPAMALIAFLIFQLAGEPMLTPAKAQSSLQSLSVFGWTPLFAALTGVLLWFSSLAGSFADNWFALRQMRAALTHQRRLVHAFGAARAERLAAWVERHVASLASNLSLATFLGMGPIIMQFFGLPLDVRHVTLSTGTVVASVASLGWESMLSAEFVLAVLGIVVIGLLNVGVAFACSLALALRARDVPARIRRLVFHSVLRRIATSPRFILLPQKREASLSIVEAPVRGVDASACENEGHQRDQAGGM